MAVTLYCSRSDLESRLSTTGVSLRIDVDPGDMTAILTRASVRVNEFLALLYDPANLAVSDWVKQQAISVALYYLCKRRANPVPGSIASDYEEACASMQAVKLGADTIYDIAARRAAAPVLSNVRVKLAPTPHTVVTPTRSTGKVTDYDQHQDQTSFITDFVI